MNNFHSLRRILPVINDAKTLQHFHKRYSEKGWLLQSLICYLHGNNNKVHEINHVSHKYTNVIKV